MRSVDSNRADSGAFAGGTRLPGYLDGIDVGTVLVHRAGDPDIPLDARPWQTGRVHLDGVRWEEKTWPVEDFIAFRDHVASLMEFTVPGDVRPQSRNLPVVTCQSELEALQSPSPKRCLPQGDRSRPAGIEVDTAGGGQHGLFFRR